MKKSILTVCLALFMATGSWAAMYTGSIDSGVDGGMYATPNWDNGNATLGWKVDSAVVDGVTLWTYEYTWTVDDIKKIKEISHIIFQVSDSFETTNIYEGTTNDYVLGLYDSKNGNPGMPGAITGLKFDTDDVFGEDVDELTYKYKIVTDKEPMWGNFYGKDGDIDKVDVIAYNTGFPKFSLFDWAKIEITSGNLFDKIGYGFVLVPDTGSGGGGGNPVPEPSTVVLLGTGLLGLLYVGRKRSRK